MNQVTFLVCFKSWHFTTRHPPSLFCRPAAVFRGGQQSLTVGRRIRRDRPFLAIKIRQFLNCTTVRHLVFLLKEREKIEKSNFKRLRRKSVPPNTQRWKQWKNRSTREKKRVTIKTDGGVTIAFRRYPSVSAAELLGTPVRVEKRRLPTVSRC